MFKATPLVALIAMVITVSTGGIQSGESQAKTSLYTDRPLISSAFKSSRIDLSEVLMRNEFIETPNVGGQAAAKAIASGPTS